MLDCLSVNEVETVPPVKVGWLSSTTDEKTVEPQTAFEITEEFFAECSKLNIGELAKCESFQLLEAMSALELMDPKMDIGMVPINSSIRFENLIADGRLNVTNMDERELIATMDAMLCALVSWLEGNPIAQTLLTCVCLHDVDAIPDPILSSYCSSVLFLAVYLKHIVETAAVCEEEDFNVFAPYMKCASLQEVIDSVKLVQKDLQRRKTKKPGDHEVIDALACRLSFIRLMILTINAMVYPPGSVERIDFFLPSIDAAFSNIKWAYNELDKIESTVHLGLKPTGDLGDGDFGWLPAFEPDINRRLLPSSFPRKTKMLNRTEVIGYLRCLCSRIQWILRELPSSIDNIESTLFFLRSFSLENSCVLSRSLLQLTYLPCGEFVMGRHPITKVIVDSIREFSTPEMFDPSAMREPSSLDATSERFVYYCAKVFLGVINIFGHNLARQREKIVCSIEDLSALQNEAEQTENDLIKEYSYGNTSHSLTSFVLYHTLLLIEYHFFLSFRLDLYAPYEFPYVYWYLSEVVFRWLVNTIDRSQNLIIMDYRNLVKELKKSKRKKSCKSKKETDLRRRIKEGQRSLLFYKAQASLSEAYFMACVGLISAGKIRVPDGGVIAEQLRFEHRMLPFSSLSSPLFLNYRQFVQMSRIEGVSELGFSKCLLHAAEAFNLARSQLEKIYGSEPLVDEAASMARICKNNAVVSRILSTGSKTDSKIELEFDQTSIMYPLLKIK